MQNTIARKKKKTRIRQRECTRFYIRLQIKISFLEDRHKTALDDLKSERLICSMSIATNAWRSPSHFTPLSQEATASPAFLLNTR